MTQFLSLLYSHHIYQLIELQTDELYLHYCQFHIWLSNVVSFVCNVVGLDTWDNGKQTFFQMITLLINVIC